MFFPLSFSTLLVLLSGLSTSAILFFTVGHSEPQLLLTAGVSLSLLAAACMQWAAGCWRQIERVVGERTAELQLANARLVEDLAACERYKAELEFHASHDMLTGLADPHLLDDRLSQAIANAQRCGHQVWTICADLDRFKFVNDTMGHKTGDQLLKKVAGRLQSTVPEMNSVARFGGDKFLLVLSESDGEVQAQHAVQRIMEAIARPFTLDGHEFFLSCSIGIAVYPAHGTDSESLIRHADIAMYRAKELGRNNFQFYTESMNQRSLERLRIEGALRNALERDEFFLHYQPQVDLRSGQIVGMETLIRWQHPELGLISPARFIGLAEETGLIVPIGAWVLRSACIQNKAWQDAGFGHLRIAVNLSARQFYQKNLVASIAAVLHDTGLAPKFLEIELTESMVMTDVERTIGILRGLKEIGVHLSIDDFGTGYSSLSYLKRFPIDVLKIDQSFVRDIAVDPDDAAIVTSIISLAHSLRLQVIAEGVETETQLAYLQRHGCDQMQGYYFSPPLPSGELTQMLQIGKSLPRHQENRSQTLLIIDDESNILSALRRLLHKDGYRILTAQTPVAALELLALNEVQVIICDQRMPLANGFEFLKRVKALYPDTMRIMLSSYAELHSVIEAINGGAAYRFFTKPWDDEVLRSNIREAFRQYSLLHDAGGAGYEEYAAPVAELRAG